MNTNDWIRYKIKRKFVDDEGKLSNSNEYDIKVGRIVEFKHKNLIWVNNELINKKDVIKFGKKVKHVIQQGDAYYFTNRKGEFVTLPTFIYYHTDLEYFEKVCDYNLKNGLVLYFLTKENLQWQKA